MLLDKQTFRNQDLVLKVSEDIDPKVFDINKYEPFLDALCREREYQKEAIRITLRYLLGGQYKNLKELAEENYHRNPILQEKYATFTDFVKNLQLPEKLYCSLDLATGTGKSFILYGLARIMLAAGVVDQVLVLCPSTTIEDGLLDKFRALSADKTLRDLLKGSGATILNPGIINASETIKKGDICVENIHATYQHVKSAIKDSLGNKGQRTLILNDEVHHMTSVSGAELKKWKEFLLDPKYNFKYIVGDSGTCYVKNDYFTDVIYRFSLRQSIEEKFVKSFFYATEGVPKNESEKFQWIYENHKRNKRKYYKLKPLTILVTKDISNCRQLTEKWIKFLAKKDKINRKTAEKKLLIVTSAPEHKDNIPKLKTVDDKRNPVEWITSVSMLSEGWDVENVFQIVPHEERAFNSKLLIAQVLGRGLRIPQAYKGEQPIVTVFNHDKWSKNIKHLVDEVLEIEKRIHSYIIPKKENYNFNLDNIDYKKTEERVEIPQLKEFNFAKLQKEGISYSTQARRLPREIRYAKAVLGDEETRKAIIELKMCPIEEAVERVWGAIAAIDMDLGTNYKQKFNKEKIKDVIKKSLKRIKDKTGWVSEENLQKTLQAFGVARRKKTKSLRYKIKAENLTKINTAQMKKDSLGVGALRRGSTIFFDDYTQKLSEDEDKKLLEELLEDESLPRSALIEVKNRYNFKTPVNITFAAQKPERDFIKKLIEDEKAKTVNAWIKSRDVGFYSIEYSWRKGEHPKQGSFNPDFFLKIGNDILVVEIKEDKAVTDENSAKLKYARKHFQRVNGLQNKQKYYFKFLSPESYDAFFQTLKSKKYKEFKSKLEASLED
ncbi:MAG: DEAD/DEAH box helicase family protein [Candidatus Pacebacteria bacterium]|nr:DEAD/DEAH box helicase family protein [Candidatus Paceibacterota bacterium]